MDMHERCAGGGAPIGGGGTSTGVGCHSRDAVAACVAIACTMYYEVTTQIIWKQFFYVTWPRGSTGVQRYGCIPRSAANTLGEIPQKLGAPNPLFSRVFLGKEHFGTRPCQSPSRFGIRLHFLRPHFPSPK